MTKEQTLEGVVKKENRRPLYAMISLLSVIQNQGKSQPKAKEINNKKTNYYNPKKILKANMQK